MSRTFLPALGAVALLLGGCQSTQQILAEEQGAATAVALRRAQFEMSCPSATATPLTSSTLQPIAWRGIERAEYTVGVSGCGRRAVYMVICPLGSSDCLAVQARQG